MQTKQQHWGIANKIGNKANNKFLWRQATLSWEEAGADGDNGQKLDKIVNQDAHCQDSAESFGNNTELKEAKKSSMSLKKLGDIIVVNNTANPTGRRQNHED